MERTVAGRLQNMFQQLEKVGGKAARNQSGEELQQMKYASMKIYQIITTAEKIHRDAILKNPAQVDLLLQTLKNATDKAVLVNIVNIISELLGKTQVSKKTNMFVSANLTNILFQTLVQEWEEQSPSEEFMLTCHQVLARLSSKDRKFALKARLNRALLITLNLIKNNICNFRVLQILLPIFKVYTNNSVNASYLGKHNSIPPVCKVMQQCGRKHASVLKYALDILNNLTKSRNNAARTIGGEYVPHILNLYNEWHQADTKHRHVSIRKGFLHVLKNITNLKSGRKALVEANGIRILYESAQDVIDCREMEGLILLASVIMRKCCPRNKLPLNSIHSVVTFEKPLSELYPEDGFEMGAAGESSSGTNEGQDSDNSSVEEDDDIDSDDERFKSDHLEENEEDQGEGEPQEFKRSPEDLRMYNQFFPELFEIEVMETESGDSIVIPTASYDSGIVVTRERPSRGQGRDKMLSIYPLNIDNFHKSVSCPSSLFRMQTSISEFSSDTGYLSGRGTQFRTNQLYDMDYIDSFSPIRPETAAAVNLKTGASVINIDFPSSQTNKSSNPRKPKSKKAKATKKTNGKDTNNKKSKRFVKESSSVPNNVEPVPAFTDALCITPIPNIREQDEFERSLSAYEDDDDSLELSHDPLLYQDMSRLTKSVYKFDKIAYPDLCGAKSPYDVEPLYHRKFGVQRAKVFEDIDRMLHPDLVIDREVYSLDAIKLRSQANFVSDNSNISNRDEFRVGSAGRYEPGPDCLRFNAQFESGNLRKAIWVRDFEYDLILNPDINVNHHHQWFYFEVSNTVADVPYRFNIVNCEKLNSQFNFGMKPLLFSVVESMEGRPFWWRTGTDICYYKNHFTRSPLATGGVKGKTYYTTTFTVTFKHNKDVCYLSYHYPYTYSTLMTHLTMWETQVDHETVFFRKQTLCETMSGNPVPVLTITAKPKVYTKEQVEQLRSRPYIFLSGRVHPGESNASWVMKGSIDFLLSKTPMANILREMFIFKIVPMLNIDGVVNGNYRCSLAGEDLNRRWDNPCPRLHPTIYHTKGLLQYLQMINKTPLVYCDYHGHSRRKNIFIYGCSAAMSWIVNDTRNPGSTGNRVEDNGFKQIAEQAKAQENQTIYNIGVLLPYTKFEKKKPPNYRFQTLPRVLESISPAFSLSNCSFLVEKSKETTARVVVWRQIGVNRSYTMESTYCGIDKEGKYKDQHISTRILEEMGHKFCEGLLRLGRGRTTYESNSTMPSEEGLEQLGACAQDPDLSKPDFRYYVDEDYDGPESELHAIHEGEEKDYCGSDVPDDSSLSSESEYGDDEEDDPVSLDMYK